MKTQRGLKIKTLLTTLFFIIAFAVVLGIHIHQQNLYNSGVEAKATVISVDAKRASQQNVTGSAVYTDENGNEYIFKGFLGGNVSVGSEITVHYDKNNPEDVIVPNSAFLIGAIVLGIFSAICIFLCVMLFFFSKTDKQAVCEHINVGNDELARIVQEGLPVTKQNFIEKREKNKRIDKLGQDIVIDRMIMAGDSIKEIYNNYQYVMENGELYLCAIIRPFDNDIYNQLISLDDDRIDTGAARYTIPAFVVYSTDEYFISHPWELKQIVANFMYISYDNNIANENDMMYFNAVHDNNARLYNVQYCGALSNNRNVLITTVVLDKNHLCNARLSNKLLYIVANPTQTKFSAILPSCYYSTRELSAF
ncbi:MAG: DUF3592 domain-containing protein [Acutalibacteraceae bacterium]|nr:DUF3592 domain-containing protein [Acutalibacteraceae bacterium]